jgi:hypothetical protein
VDRDRKYAIVDVYTFLHPLHASTDANGHYRIDGLPVGTVKIVTAHPHLPGMRMETEIVVESGVVRKLDVAMDILPLDSPTGADAGRDDDHSAWFRPIPR